MRNDFESDCCAEQIPGKTLKVSIFDLLSGDTISKLYDTSPLFYTWWLELLAVTKPWEKRASEKHTPRKPIFDRISARIIDARMSSL